METPINRPLELLKEPWVHNDCTFSDDRLDGVPIDLGMFAHCTFSNVSFKGCILNDTRFINCTFIACYFRKTTIQNSQFDGCKFIDCDFPKVRIQSTKFMFPKFRGCFVEFGEMEPNLPPEPELRSLAAADLAREAQTLGHPRDARHYRIVALRARESHLWRAFTGASSYYKEHFDPLQRVQAGAQWLGSQANRLVWGNGERGLTLLFNFLLLTLVAFPLVFHAVGGVSVPDGSPAASDYVLLSVDVVTSYSGLSHVMLTSNASRVVASAELVVGLIAFGFFVTILFRRVTRWR
jgi:Pentapeptide repeats (9 copies)